MNQRHPDPSEHSEYFKRYIDLVPEDDVVTALEKQGEETQRLLSSLDDAKAAHRYAPDKWTVKGVIGHIADTERVFGYRLMSIARGETRHLAGFDENEYARHAHFDSWSLRDLADSLALVRKSNLVMMRNLNDDDWNRRGVANENVISTLAIAFVMLGHERHHLRVLRERYLA